MCIFLCDDHKAADENGNAFCQLPQFTFSIFAIRIRVSKSNIEVLCQAARVRGVEVEALCEVIRRNIQNVFFKA